jgi:hypothetical protein
MTARVPKSITISDRRLWVDGADFPFYIADPGPTVVNPGDGSQPYVEVRILFFDDMTIVTDTRNAQPTRVEPALGDEAIDGLGNRLPIEVIKRWQGCTRAEVIRQAEAMRAEVLRLHDAIDQLHARYAPHDG